jgi:hypothetical protein
VSFQSPYDKFILQEKIISEFEKLELKEREK